MMSALYWYRLKLTYIEGKKMAFADLLSRTPEKKSVKQY